jgi:nucleotidyltransferase substrate binding protein (TIGR01987 family)
MNLKTEHLSRSIETLETSLAWLRKAPAGSVDYEIFRNATVKGFELTLETAGKLLRKAIKSYVGNPRAVDELTYKDVLRHAAKHGLLDTATVERWFVYRANRNNTAHDYGEGFAEETLALLPDFINDARRIETTLHEKFGHADN